MDFIAGTIESVDSITTCELLRSLKETWQTKLKMVSCHITYLTGKFVNDPLEMLFLLSRAELYSDLSYCLIGSFFVQKEISSIISCVL